MTELEARVILGHCKVMHGNRYKGVIRNAWESGNYRRYGLEKYSAELQQMRNKFGPSWLNRTTAARV